MTDARTAGVILVTGATGTQGGAVIDALLEAETFSVRALVRNPESAAAQLLAARGVAIAAGDFEDKASLAAALEGVSGIFSVQRPPSPDDLKSEIRAVNNLIAAARDAGVDTFVQTSVARAGEHESFAGWNEGRWWPDYWTSKAAVNEAVKSAGLPHWTILKPAYIMDNLLPPKAAGLYPTLSRRGVLETAFKPDTVLHFIAAADIGRAAVAAFENSAQFNGQEIDLAGDALTIGDVARYISRATGRQVTACSLSAKEAIAAGNHPGVVSNQKWANVEGYNVDIDHLTKFGMRPISFSEWAARHAAEFDIGGA